VQYARNGDGPAAVCNVPRIGRSEGAKKTAVVCPKDVFEMGVLSAEEIGALGLGRFKARIQCAWRLARRRPSPSCRRDPHQAAELAAWSALLDALRRPPPSSQNGTPGLSNFVHFLTTIWWNLVPQRALACTRCGTYPFDLPQNCCLDAHLPIIKLGASNPVCRLENPTGRFDSDLLPPAGARLQGTV
jgi:hypothetical protein